MNEPMPCPFCGRSDPQEIKFTWWGGVIGPKVLHHVKCMQCGKAYNGKSGKSNTTGIAIYTVVVTVIVLGLILLLRAM